MGWITTKKATRSLEILWFPALGIWTYKWEDLFCLIAGHDFSGAEPKSGNRPESRDPLVAAVYVFSETFGKVIHRGPFSSQICAVPWPHARHVFSKTLYCGELVVHRLFIHQLKHVKTTFAKISPKNPWKSPGIYGNIWVPIGWTPQICHFWIAFTGETTGFTATQQGGQDLWSHLR
jgi:hypothetical protein